MLKNTNITASIALYKPNKIELQKAIDSFINSSLSVSLYLIDNSPKKQQNLFKQHKKVNYIFTGKNIGFGAAHNLILSKIEKISCFHLILNPDVFFNPKILHELVNVLSDASIALIAPKVLFLNNKIQYTARKYPRFKELVGRYLGLFSSLKQQQHYSNINLAEPFYPDFIHGAFLLFKTKDLVKIGGFDERYFLYMEDVDICRKIDALGKKKLYYPKVSIYHTLKRGSSKKIHLFFHHVFSMIKYYHKWGFKP